MQQWFLVRKSENVRRNEMAKGEFTHEALFKVVVAVTDVILILSIFVVAMLFGKLFFQMPKRIE